MKSLVELLLVAGGGALGAMSRFGIYEISERFVKSDFPFGTFISNVVGCFLIGVLIGSGRSETSQTWRLAFGVGFLGALTTFSTFGAETIRNANDGELGMAVVNIVANIVVGLTAVIVGIWLGRNLSAANPEG